MSIKNKLVYFVSQLISKTINRYWQLVYITFRNRYQLADTFVFNGHHILFYGEGDIICGQHSYVGDNSTLYAAKEYKLVVGDGCQISSNVRIFTQTAIADSDFSRKPVPSKFGNVIIGSDCWIGANVLINPNITIGDNAVIGANSVVSKDIPAGEIWGGVPARLIRKKLIIS
jgi:maltose O-acetyltransferase